jgi:hypothetical protein
MKLKITIVMLLALAVALNAADFCMEKAQKIEKFLQRIALPRQPSLFLKKATFNEAELNSYLNLLYTKKYAPEVTFINLRLGDKDEVSGSVKVKLSGEKYSAVPQFLRDIDVSFQGKFECANYRMRYLFRDLVINGTRYSPEVLDEAFGVAQINVKTKKSIFDWFTLLPGLKKVQCADKTIYFYY